MVRRCLTKVLVDVATLKSDSKLFQTCIPLNVKDFCLCLPLARNVSSGFTLDKVEIYHEYVRIGTCLFTYLCISFILDTSLLLSKVIQPSSCLNSSQGVLDALDSMSRMP